MTIVRDDSRPLLPTDEYQINSQLAKSHGVIQRGSPNFAVRSSSNRNIADLNVRKPAPLQKALTDTDNFIQMHAKRSQQTATESSENESRTEELADDSSAYDDQYSSDSENASLSSGNDRVLSSESDKEYLDLGHRMDLDPRLKKQREEWADRGAAKIVREVTNPETGKTMRHVVKKGIKDFAFGDTLGDGSYSTVLLATSKESGKKYAVKVLSKEYLIRQKKVKYVNIEKSALQRLNNSRGIIKLFFTFQDESSLYFLLEYAPNGDFLSVMKKYGSLNEDCACYYAAQIIDSISFLHSKGIIHRDIKPENILLDKDMKIKLTDFGTAKILEPESDSIASGSAESFDLLSRSKSFVGTAEYVSPELLNDNFVDYRCDIWAFGCILFQMIAGKPPFKATNEYLTFQKVMKVQYAFTAGFPLVVRDLVKGILVKQPDQRLTIPQIERHHFFKDTNFKDGSVWDNPAPEILPYKISAKSMQPIPALSSGTIPRRPVITRAYAKSTSNLPNNSVSNGSSNLSKLPPSSPTVTSTKKALDERTAQILQNAKRAVGNRKSSNQGSRRAASGAALAASAALTRKASDSPSPQVAGTAHKVKASATCRSSGSISTSQIGTGDKLYKSTRSSSGAISSFGKTSSSLKAGSIEKTASHSMNKTDISWSYFLKNIEERVLGVGEVNLAVVPTDTVEKRVSKVHGLLEDPDYALSIRKTRLSQVVRAGGDVTGFRTDPNQSIPPETAFYEELGFDHDDISKDYRKPGGEVPQSPIEEKKVGSSSAESNGSEELGNLAIAGKFKKLFHHTNSKPENGTEPIEASDYFKRMLLVTNQGRCLVLVKKARAAIGAASNYQQIYDIDLCQPATRLKEIILPSVESNWRIFSIQTPFNSFVCKTSGESSGNWLRTITRSIKTGHEFVTARSRKDDQLRSEAFVAARLVSPTFNHGPNFSENGESHPASSPSSPVKITETSSSTASSDNKHGSSATVSGATKASRFFDNFISSKERTPKKHASPVPLPTKLVNGLPAHSPSNVLGLGLSDAHRESISSPTTPSEPRKIVTSANSRLLARSEHTLRASK